MGIIDIIVFVAFVAAVLFVGLYKSKGEDTHGEEGAADYFLAGRGLTWWLIGFSLIAANISAEQFVGMSGQGAGLYGARFLHFASSNHSSVAVENTNTVAAGRPNDAEPTGIVP